MRHLVWTVLLALPAALAGGVGTISLGHAQPVRDRTKTRVHLTVEASCSNESAFFVMLEARTPRVIPARQDPSALRVRVRVEEHHGVASGILELVEPSGRRSVREVQGASCGEVVSALSFVTAVALDPTLALESPDAAAAPAKPRPDPDSRWSPRSSPGSIRASAGFGMGVGGGVGPETAIGLVAWAQGTWRASTPSPGLRVAFFRPLSQQTDTPLGTASFSAMEWRLEPCVAVGITRATEARGCGVASWVRLAGRGDRTVDPQEETRTWWRLGLSVGVRQRLIGPLGLTLEGGATAATRRPRFFFAPDVTAYRAAPTALFADAGLDAHFW